MLFLRIFYQNNLILILQTLKVILDPKKLQKILNFFEGIYFSVC